MRCFFITDGHVVAAEELFGLSDQEAVEGSKLLFEQASGRYQTFEVWQGTRFVYRHTPRANETKVAIWPRR